MKKIFYLLISILILSCNNKDAKLPDNFDLGTTENGQYKNKYFNMEVTFNPDWIVQDKQQMNDILKTGNDIISGDDKNLKSAIKAGMVNTAYLLTIFKHEAGAPVTFNPSFTLLAENTKNAPGIKRGKDYLYHVRNLLEQSQITYFFDKEVFERKIGSTTFYVMESKVDVMDKTITQEYMTKVTKGFSLSIIISYMTSEEKEELYAVIKNIKI